MCVKHVDFRGTDGRTGLRPQYLIKVCKRSRLHEGVTGWQKAVLILQTAALLVSSYQLTYSSTDALQSIQKV